MAKARDTDRGTDFAAGQRPTPEDQINVICLGLGLHLTVRVNQLLRRKLYDFPYLSRGGTHFPLALACSS